MSYVGALLYFAIISLTIFQTKLSHAAAPPAGEICQGQDCTETMKGIQQSFLAANHPWQDSDFPMLATGECFHLMQGLKPEDRHWGMFILDKATPNAPITMSGVLSFYGAKNDFAELTLAQAREYAKQRGSKQHPVEISGPDIQVVIPSEKSNIYYSFRENAETREVYMLSLWDFFASGGRQKSFCRLTQSPTSASDSSNQ